MLLNALLVMMITCGSSFAGLCLFVATWLVLNFSLLTGTFYVNDKANDYCKEYSAHLKVTVT